MIYFVDPAQKVRFELRRLCGTDVSFKVIALGRSSYAMANTGESHEGK